MFFPFEPGKLTEEVKTHLPDVTKLLAARKAASMGMSMSDYLRDLVCDDIHNAPYDELMLAHRRKVRAEQQGQIDAQSSPGFGPGPAHKAGV